MTSVEQLRRRVQEVGRTTAVAEEMVRLGFLTNADLIQIKLSQEQVAALSGELKLTIEQLREAEQKLAGLSDTAQLLKEIRAERIAMVKEKSAERKVEKERLRTERHEAWELKKRTEAPFLGHGVSHRLIFEGGNSERLAFLKLPKLDSFSELASAMKFETSDLVWLCYERGASEVDHYNRFEIPKRAGGTRLISSPKGKMRKAQNWVNENILRLLEPSKYCYAFRPEISIVHNATQHLNKALIVKYDIKDFFPSITFGRVRGYFEYLGYNPGMATVLALVCTDAPRVRVTIRGSSQIVAVGERSLPQGACTSPALSNLIASRLDNRLAGFAKTVGVDWTYTRYADDLTFSTNDQGVNLGSFLAAVTKITADEKFEIKRAKTRIMRAPKRQTVTGLLVGNEVRIPKSTIKSIRALFHNIETKGQDAVSEQIGKNALPVAQGYWSYMHMVNPELAAKYLKRYSWLRQK
jgi:retron-type reverse transcriptase